jgi:two-component system, sporulation sensor kinase E
MGKRFTERLIERIEQLDHRELGGYLVGLAREKGLLENIFNSMQEGLLVIQPEGTISLLNHSAARFLDIPADSAGRDFNAVIDDPGLQAIIEQGLEVPGQALVREFIMVHPQPRWVRLSRTGLNDGGGKFRGVLLILADITRQRKSEAETSLVERLDFLGHLTAGVAHEIGNPISSLFIQTQLIERQVVRLPSPQREKISRTLSIIREELRRLDGIVRQFLKTLRPETLQLHENDLAEVVEEVAELVERELNQKHISLVREYAGGDIRGRMDKDLIKQAVLNLIKNAAQAMVGGGEITIRLERENAYLKLAVSDQGTGIPGDKIPRLFEPFFTTRETGSGMGLLVVYKAIRQHGGYVEVSSQAGEGTTFTIWLPRRPKKIKLLPAGKES